MKIKRCCVFAHFDKGDIVDDYVLEYLIALKPFVCRLVFVSTSRLNRHQIEKVEALGADVICRENVGHDFYSWKTGIQSLALGEYDELLQVNDSCYAPLFDFGPLFNEMSATPCDFWGISECYRYSKHIQSYFVCYRKPVLESSVFQHFWEALTPISDKVSLVRNYEVGLSRLLIRNKFSLACYFKLTPIEYLCKFPMNFLHKIKITRNLNPYKYIRSLFVHNPSFYYYQEMLKHKVPFIKVGLIRDISKNIPVTNLRLVEGIDVKMVGLLRNHQNRLYSNGKIPLWVPDGEASKESQQS